LSRHVYYTILFDLTDRERSSNGRFQNYSPTAPIDGNSRRWFAFSASNFTREDLDHGDLDPADEANPVDNAILLPGDSVRFRVGEKVTPHLHTSAVKSIDVAVLFGRHSKSQEEQNHASPFAHGTRHRKCLFQGSYQIGAPEDQQTLKKRHRSFTGNGYRYDVNWYELKAGLVQLPPRSGGYKFEFMIGANVTTIMNEHYSFGHDPEVDVGNEPGTP
jgi:hypothetical protein